MAAKSLSSAIARYACALVSCAFLVSGLGAYAQETTRPGCVVRYANGKPYVFCKSEDDRARRARERQKWSPPVASRPSSPTTSGPWRRQSVERPSSSAGGGGGTKAGAAKAQPGSRPTAAPRIGYSAGKATVGKATAAGRLQAVRALIEPADMPPREVAGYGVVAFTTRPLPHDIARYKSVCEAYKAALISEAELPPDTPLSVQMITYWPIANKSTPEARRADCTHLVSNYALRLGLDAIQDADKQKEELASRRGPFLIAWAPSESRFAPDALVLIMDLSALDGERSFTEVFQEWRQNITDNPELWRRGGFNVEAVRRIIRDTFDRYGDGLLRLITKS